MDQQYHLTKERLEELKRELETLKDSGRQNIAERLKRAKDFGDLSENAEYAEAREEQAQVETRIFQLEEMIKNAVVIKKTEGSDTVEIGSTVTVQKDGKTFKYAIVGSDEASPGDGRISDESPLGKAFLHHTVGEKVTVSTPTGAVVYTITKIE